MNERIVGTCSNCGGPVCEGVGGMQAGEPVAR